MTKVMGRIFCVSVALTGIASADPFIDFGILPITPTGSVSYAGGSNPLIGTGIPVVYVIGANGTPSNNGVLSNCVSCTLSFTTGGLTGTSTSSWVFGSGGSISLSGTVDIGSNGIDPGDPTGTLLSGSFSQPATVTAIAGSGFTFNLVGAAFGAALDPGLLGFYGLGGLPANQGNMNLSFFSASVPPSAFNSSFVASGNLTAKTPEPLSLALLGTVLLLCSGAAVRRMRKARK